MLGLKKAACAAFIVLFGLILVSSAGTRFYPEEYSDFRAQAFFWTAKTSGDVLLSGEELQELNAELFAGDPFYTDLKNFPQVLDGAEVRSDIAYSLRNVSPRIPKLYAPRELLNEEQYQRALDNCAQDNVPLQVKVRYAAALRRTSLRVLPTSEMWLEDPGDERYDNLQGSIINPLEPLAVLHDSADGLWYYVHTRSYVGWVLKSDLGFAGRAVFEELISPASFAVVTADKVRLSLPSEVLRFEMGARRPLVKESPGTLTVRLPMGNQGRLSFYEKEVARGDDFSVGYLPYSRANVISQAFRFLGNEYGWGGLNEGVDCSSFVQDVYASVGVFLPRNSGSQNKAVPLKTDIPADLSEEQISELIGKAKPGSLLFIRGHVMLYLGEADGENLVIHACSSLGRPLSDGTLRKVYLRRVTVTSLHNLSMQKKPLLKRVYAIGDLTGR